MTCTACGEHPKENTAKDFTKAVIEIDNPETLVLLRKVVIPASMGDETAFPPAIGKYFNVLLHYEASGSNYLYSSDGIPTEIGANIPQELLDRIEALEDGYDDLAEDYEQLQSQVGDVSEALSAETSARENADIGLQGQIDALTASSGVIDVLGTYQDLQNYDTTHVKEDDIIKVLQDSTHSNAMSYYKWVITSNVGAWVYVGGEGPFYTKSEADVLLNSKQNTEDNSLDTTRKTIVGAINEVDSIAKGANQALSYGNYSTMVTAFNSLDDDVYKVGQNIYIVTTEVPDLWISGVESTSQTYTYTTDEAFTTELNTNGYVQVGYYKLSALETQKADLTNYVTFDDYATAATTGVVKTSAQYGVSTSSYTKNLTGSVRTYAQYQSGNDVTIICKGTLENVITGKGLVTLDEFYKAFPTDTASGAVASFTDGADDLPLKSLVVNIDPVQDLNGYSYPWPAGGGKNLFNGTFLQGYWAYANGAWINSRNWITTEKIPCKASTSYTVSADAKATRWQGFVWYDSNGNFISTDNLQSNVNIGLTKTSPSNAAYLIFNIAGYPGANDTIAPSDVTHFQLEEGSSSTAYAPYSNICPISGYSEAKVYVSPTQDAQDATVYTIDLDGARYGGTLDVTTGKLTVDRAMVDLGTRNWYPSPAAGRTRFRTGITDIERISSPNIVAPMLCSNYPTKTANQTYQGTTGISLQQNSADIHIYDPQMESMTGEEFKSAMSGVQLVYKLATPIEIQLAPHELNTLLGVNNIWANTGDTEVEYRADTKLYINKMI